PTAKLNWMRYAPHLLALASTGGKDTMGQLIMIQQIMKTVNTIAKVHKDTKKARLDQELKASVEHNLVPVQSAVPDIPETPSNMAAIHAAAFPNAPEQATRQSSPMPSAIPKRQVQIPQPTRERDGFSR